MKKKAREPHISFHRLHHIHLAFVNHRNVSTAKLAEELEVSERTIRRDMEELRSEHGLIIDYEPVTRTWFCADPGGTLPLFQVTANETIALTLANRTFAAWHGTGLGQALESILTKLGKAVSGAMTLPVTDIAPLYQPDTNASREHRYTPRLIQAIQQHEVIRITYRKPQANAEVQPREIWPLRLACQDLTWSLVAWDPKISELRTFVLIRIESVEHATGCGSFSPPEGLDIDQRLQHAIGLWSGDEVFEVAVRFDAGAAPYLREKPWHPTQAIEELPDGGLIARFTLNHLMDIQAKILSWGEHAEALEPPELRRNLASIAAKLTQTYAPISQ
ncbi:MAG: WYL domain-containing protein [Opitutales bacterium]|nr:WYL domain-containing protein [Opitutales bacterium]